MCGRFANTETVQQQAARFNATVTAAIDAWQSSWNITPGLVIPVLIDVGSRRLGGMRWGWKRDWSSRELINAQVEKLTTSTTWRAAYERRRCVVPATGWWEWRQDPDGKFPYFHTLPEDTPVAFAGIWERQGADGAVTVVTQPATAAAATIHHRMPVLVTGSRIDAWLQGGLTELDRTPQAHPITLRRARPLRANQAEPEWSPV